MQDNKVLNINGRMIRAEVAAKNLAGARERLGRISDPMGKEICAAEIARIEAALAAAGLDESGEFAPVDLRSRKEIARSEALPRRIRPATYTSMVDEEGDINTLLRRHGNSASAE
jgi:hypothetical protein